MVYGIDQLMPSPPTVVALGRDSLTGLPCEPINTIAPVNSVGHGKRKHDGSIQSELAGLTREERRRRRRATLKYRTAHATREYGKTCLGN